MEKLILKWPYSKTTLKEGGKMFMLTICTQVKK